MKKVFYLVLCIILLLSTGCTDQEKGEVVEFPDSYLEEAIKEALSIPLREEIRANDLLTIKELVINTRKSINGEFETISNLEGIQYLENLEILILETQKIEDLTQLRGLKNLQTLWLGNNLITDLSPLEELKMLKELRLEYNKIEDIHSLSDLTSLENLTLFDNQIKDISSIGQLPNLRTLWIHTNSIEDISSLKNLESIEKLHVVNNPIKNIENELMKMSSTMNEAYISATQLGDKDLIDKIPYKVHLQ